MLSGVTWSQPDTAVLCTSNALYLILLNRSLVNTAFLQHHHTELETVSKTEVNGIRVRVSGAQYSVSLDQQRHSTAQRSTAQHSWNGNCSLARYCSKQSILQILLQKKLTLTSQWSMLSTFALGMD